MGRRVATFQRRAELGAVRLAGLRNQSESLNDWTSPAKALFADFHPADRKALAARYQELFLESVRQWEALHPQPEKEEKAKKSPDAKEPGLSDPGLEAFRQLLYEKFGPFRPPADSRRYFPVAVSDQIAALEKEEKALVERTPDLPRAMGVCEGDHIGDLAIHIRGSHWNLGQTVPRRFLRVIAGDNQPPLSNKESGRLELARVADREGSPSHQPGDGEPPLALALRQRHRAFHR